MSKEARAWASRQRVDDRTLRLVLHALAWAADKGTGECRTSQADIASEAGVKERAVRYALVVLERLEIISRKPRSKGKYGRTTDLVMLALDRNFDVSRAAVQAVRKALKTPLQPAPRAGEYNPVDPEVPYQEEVNTKVEGCSSTSGETHPHERDGYASNVIPLMSRGAA